MKKGVTDNTLSVSVLSATIMFNPNKLQCSFFNCCSHNYKYLINVKNQTFLRFYFFYSEHCSNFAASSKDISNDNTFEKIANLEISLIGYKK